MRMRKKHWAKDMIAQRTDCVIAAPEEMKGCWRELAADREIRVEIGSGKGDYWISMAHLYPDCLWIAVEKDESCVGIALKKCLDNTTSNMKIINGDATDIDKWFDENEVDVIHLNFSDPWPKKRQTKRRLTYGTFLQQYNRILKKGGRVIMKTDNVTLFEYSLVSFDENGWHLKEVSVDYRRDPHQEDAITEYEASFMELGQPIYRAMWQVEKEVCHD